MEKERIKVLFLFVRKWNGGHYEQFIFPQFSNLENTILTHTQVFQETKGPLNLPDFGEKKIIDRFFLYQVPAGNQNNIINFANFLRNNFPIFQISHN
jgi:hypothetical protein